MNQKEAYSNDDDILVLRCLNCGKPLEWSHGRRNKYFCNRYCRIKYTYKMRMKNNAHSVMNEEEVRK